jgi:hypothetical protein
MIYTAPCVIVLMRADTLRGEVGGGGGGAGNREFFGPLEMPFPLLFSKCIPLND